MTQALMFAAFSLLTIDALIAWAWVFRYRRRDWNTTEYGRHLMRFSLLVAVALSFTVLFGLVDEPPWLGLGISCVVYVGLGAELLNRHRLLGRANHREDPPSV